MPLVNRPQPILHEQLESWLERLRLANYYEEKQWFRAFLLAPIPVRMDLLRNHNHYVALSELTGIAIDRLYSLTLHRFVIPMYGSQRVVAQKPESDDILNPLWDHDGYSTYVHGSRTNKLCPLCWQEHKALLLPWSLRHVTTCYRHRTLLLDQCPQCQAPLSIDQATGKCQQCETHISTLPSISISEHYPSRLLTRLMWSAIGCSDEVFPPPDLVIRENHPLQSMSPSTFLRWLWHAGQMIEILDPYHPLFQKHGLPSNIIWDVNTQPLRESPNKQVHIVFCAMCRLLEEWPTLWESTLERILIHERTQPFFRFPNILNTTFKGDEWLWLHLGWMDFMRARLFISSDVKPWLRYYRDFQERLAGTYPRLLSQREAAQTLGISQSTLKQYIDSNHLKTTPYQTNSSKRPWQLIDAESVRILQEQRAAHLSLAQVAAVIGTSEEGIVALVEADMLHALCGPLVDGQTVWRFDPNIIFKDMSNIIGHVPVQEAEPDKFDISNFATIQRILTRYKMSLPHILQEVQKKKLPMYRSANVVRIDVLWCDDEQLRHYQEHARKSHFSLLSVNMVCKRLRCKPNTLQHFTQAGLLIPIENTSEQPNDRYQYREEDIALFQEKYITSNEAALLLNITHITIQQWARIGRIQAVAGTGINGNHAYYFDKEALKQWRSERLTFGEAMAMLQVSKATLHRWVEQGKLRSLNDMGGTQRWFARHDVELLCS